MRRFTPRRAEAWVTEAKAFWMSLRDRLASYLDTPETDERRRLVDHGFALGVVSAAALLQWIVGAWAAEPAFWLFQVAIALTAAYRGAAPALVAILFSVLLARLVSAVPLSTALLSGVEGLLVAVVVLALTKLIQDLRVTLASLNTSLNTSIGEFKSAEQYARRVDAALSRLDQASEDVVLVVLDRAGHVNDWRAGAARLYGFESREMLGRSAATIFCDLGEADFARLVSEGRQSAIRRNVRQLRADGSTFAAEIQIGPLGPDGLDGAVMIVRDLTYQQARAAADSSTAEAHARLHDEIELARRQLSALQHVTDPALNSFGDSDSIPTLLDRLCTSINAEGIALIGLGRVRPHLCCASSGLQCHPGEHHSPFDAESDTGRTLMLHNDPRGVAEMSAAMWPSDVSSLIAVPVVRAGSQEAVMEVVSRTGRRATEWEIALVQVVAARVAGYLEDDPQVDSGAAWTASSVSPISRSGPDAGLRLSLGEHGLDRR